MNARIIIILFLVSSSVCAEKNWSEVCEAKKILISLVDYYYCEDKNSLKSIRILGGKHPTVYITTENWEYSFSKMPVSIAILNIPKKQGITVRDFFERLADRNYLKGRYKEIRSTFEITEYSTVSMYVMKKINAVYIINEASAINSIYLFNEDEKNIYLVKGNFNENFSRKLLSKLIFYYLK